MDDLTKEFISIMVDSGRMQGAEPLIASMFANLYIEPEDLSLEYLAKITGYSLASVSNKAKMLETIGLIQRIRKPGTKKAFFRIEKDIIGILRKQFMKKEQIHIKTIKDRLPKVIDKYKRTKLTDEQKEKLKIMKDYYEQTLLFEKIIKDTIKRLEERK